MEMECFLELFKRLFARTKAANEEYSVVGARLKQIEHDPHRHQYNFDVLDDMHLQQQELKHARRAEHHARSFWGDKRADHPDELIEDRSLPLHPSAQADRQAAREHMIKAGDSDKLYRYTSEFPTVKDE
jgi:hypothetical protein